MSFSENAVQFVNVRIVGETKTKDLESGTIVNFRIVQNKYDKRKNADTGHFFDCRHFISAQSKNPAFWVDSLQAGKIVSLMGRASQDQWEKDGVKKSKVVFDCQTVIPHYQPPVKNQPSDVAQRAADILHGEVISDEQDVPF